MGNKKERHAKVAAARETVDYNNLSMTTAVGRRRAASPLFRKFVGNVCFLWLLFFGFFLWYGEVFAHLAIRVASRQFLVCASVCVCVCVSVCDAGNWKMQTMTRREEIRCSYLRGRG